MNNERIPSTIKLFSPSSIWKAPFIGGLVLKNIYMVQCINILICHTAIENLSDPIGYFLDFTNPYYTALASNIKHVLRKKDNSF
jgi:hypothetical protein